MRLRHLLPALLAFTVPATAATFDQARVTTRVVENANGVFAEVTVTSNWGALVDADMRLTVDGREIKVEPVSTATYQLFNEYLAPAGTTVYACATLQGNAWTGPGDAHQPVQVTACAFHSSEMGTVPNRTGAERLRVRPGISPAMRPIVR